MVNAVCIWKVQAVVTHFVPSRGTMFRSGSTVRRYQFLKNRYIGGKAGVHQKDVIYRDFETLRHFS